MKTALCLMASILFAQNSSAEIPQEAYWVYYVYDLSESEDTRYYSYYATAFILQYDADSTYIGHAMNCIKVARLTEQDEWLNYVLQCAQQKVTDSFDSDFEDRLNAGLVPMVAGMPTKYEDFQAGLRISQRLFNEALGKK